MATTVKLTITLPKEQLAEIHALVASGQTPTISAFVKHAVAVSLADAAGWKEMLADALEQTGGPLSKKERAWVDAQLSPPKSTRKRKAA